MAPACGAAVLLAIGAVAAFGDAVLANGFGVRLSPHVGAERGVVGLAGEQAIEHVFEVGPDIVVVAGFVPSSASGSALLASSRSQWFRKNLTSLTSLIGSKQQNPGKILLGR